LEGRRNESEREAEERKKEAERNAEQDKIRAEQELLTRERTIAGSIRVLDEKPRSHQ
jgi:uncharacterized membrane protein YqiK